MDIWLIKDGEKRGPLPDYEIRSRITAGDLDGDTRAWHEGLPEWSPLSEIAIFKNEFVLLAKPVPAVDPEPVAAPSPPQPPPIPEKPKLIRRFWARWLDIHVYIALWWLALWAAGKNIEAIYFNQWIFLTQLVPWFVIEIYLIHRFATTPGKWLLGLHVLNADGSHLTLGESTRRALRVFGVGIGLGWSVVAVFCMGLSAVTAKRLGSPLWDYIGKHRVPSKPLNAWRILATILLFFIAIQAQIAVVAPYQIKAITSQAPQLKEFFDKQPQWSLPQRHK